MAAQALPGSPAASIAQALALQRHGQLEEAADICTAIQTANPNRTDALHLLGLIRHQQGRNLEALQLVEAVLKRAPRSADILNDHGLILAALAKHQDALACFDAALALRPDHVYALKNRAASLKRLGRPAEALAAYEAVLASRPDDLDSLNECGGLQARLGHPAAAVACYDRALAVAPHVAELHINKGTALVALRRFDDALNSFAAALAVDPERAEAHYNAALVHLRRGDFKTGWRQYEWRRRKPEAAASQRDFGAPLWLGEEPIAGKTIFLVGEQGYGDTIQTVRYAPLVAARGATVILGVQAPLKRLAATISGVTLVLGEGEPVPQVDFYCPLFSLPLAFGTELDTVPANIPYVRPEPQRLAHWRARLPSGGRLRVGICWAGSPLQLNDHNRSIPLQRFAEELLTVSNLDFVSVQKQVSAAEAALLKHYGVMHLGCEFTDFADTAAALALLGLLICVDTSVAHLAGALGKAVALLLPYSPDFRWLLDRADSPWYPTMRLFRQTAIGAWDGPLGRLRQELTAVAQRRPQPRAANA